MIWVGSGSHGNGSNDNHDDSKPNITPTMWNPGMKCCTLLSIIYWIWNLVSWFVFLIYVTVPAIINHLSTKNLRFLHLCSIIT